MFELDFYYDCDVLWACPQPSRIRLKYQDINEYIVGFANILLSSSVFPEQSVFISLYLMFWMSKSHENFTDGSRLLYLSFGSRITYISILVRELQSLQVGVSVQTAFWNSSVVISFCPI